MNRIFKRCNLYKALNRFNVVLRLDLGRGYLYDIVRYTGPKMSLYDGSCCVHVVGVGQHFGFDQIEDEFKKK